MNIEIPTLKSIPEMTKDSILKLKVSDLSFCWENIPPGYQKAIVRLIRDLAETKLTDEDRKYKHESLGEMWEQVAWIVMQKKIMEELK